MTVKYQDLLESVSERTGLDSGAARAAAEATVAALGRTLEQHGRDRFKEVLPGELKSRVPVDAPAVRDEDEGEFVHSVTRLDPRPPEEARLRAQAVLSALAEHEPDLMQKLDAPEPLGDLFVPPAAGGGVTGPAGGEAPLTAEEVDAALATLPDWSGDTRELRRPLVLPPANLDRVLRRIAALGEDETGRRPEVRREADGVELAVSTASVRAVTSRDVELAARVDDVIDDAAAGIS